MNANRADLRQDLRKQQVPSIWANLSLPFSERKVLLMTVDIILISLSILAGLWLWRATDAPELTRELLSATLQSYWWLVPVLSLTWLALGWAFDLYHITLTNRRLAMLPHLGGAMATLIAGYLVFYFLAPVQALPRPIFVYFVLGATLSLGLWRWTYATVLTIPRMQLVFKWLKQLRICWKTPSV